MLMKIGRAKFYDLAQWLETLGNSRELSLAFNGIEQAQMFLNKHLCLVDPQAVKEDIDSTLANTPVKDIIFEDNDIPF